MTPKTLLPLFSLILLTSCTLGPTYHAPTDKLPSHYISTTKQVSTAQNNTRWWNALNDPLLVKLINQALNGDGGNLDLQKAQAQIRQARANVGIVSADFYPELNANGKISRDHLSRNSEILAAVPTPIPLHYTDYQLGFDASWELDFFGRTRRSKEAAYARLEGAIEARNNVAITVAAEIARLYTQYRVYQQRIAVAKHTIDSYNKTAELIKLQMQAGSATGVDLQRVESEVLSAKSALPPLEAEAQATLAALSVMAGQYPETLQAELSHQSAPIPSMMQKNLVVGLPSDLLQNRPDIKIAERELAASTADIGVAVADQFPRFQLVGRLGTDTVFPGTLADAASHYWSLTPQFTAPLFQGGRLRNTVKDREAKRDVALANYKQSVLQALADVESALIRYERERVKKQELKKSEDKLKSAVALVRIQYREGKTSLIDVLDVERQLDQISDQHVQSAGQETIYLVSLYKALGGGWM